MDRSLQPKLLEVVEEQRLRRLGGRRDGSVDLRLSAATRHHLGLLMQQKRFREDLYFRISTLPSRQARLSRPKKACPESSLDHEGLSRKQS